MTLVRVGDRSISGIELRELLGLRSSDFDFALQDGTFTFTTLGYGHGVGLSQYGADYLRGREATITLSSSTTTPGPRWWSGKNERSAFYPKKKTCFLAENKVS